MGLDKGAKFLVTGNEGMVGTSLLKRLRAGGYTNILTPLLKDLDLRDQAKTDLYFKENKPVYVIHLAARVGGIKANKEAPAGFLYDNLIMECNVIESARKYGVKKLLFMGSACIYPRDCNQPMKEEDLMTGKLEPTNEGYSLAKIIGLKLCEMYNMQYGTNFINLLPNNLYGPYDHFGEEGAHVIPSLMTRFFEAKEKGLPSVEVWGTGKVEREFLFVEDMVEAIVYFMENYDADKLPPFVNVGNGKDVSIKELAFMIKEIVGYEGEVKFDPQGVEGMPKRLMDGSKAAELGLEIKTDLKEGLEKTYKWYMESMNGKS
jgi:GDP-L-fucose synthase